MLRLSAAGPYYRFSQPSDSTTGLAALNITLWEGVTPGKRDWPLQPAIGVG